MFALLLLTLLWPGQAEAEDQSARFYVERVNVFSKYDSAFVLELANSLVPPGRKVGDAEVQYLTGLLDAGDFLRIIADKGIKTGVPLLQFTRQEMNEKIDDSIRESLPPELAKKASGSAWISFKPDGQSKIEILVSPERPQFPAPAAATN